MIQSVLDCLRNGRGKCRCRRNNTSWGFWGTIAQHAEASEAWALAVLAIVTATGFGEEAVRA